MRHAVILAGGGGTRLWPASRKAHAKQFLALGTGSESLLTATARRLQPTCEDHLWVVTASEQVAQVRSALPALSENAVIAEPLPRNTAAALGLAAVHLLERDPDAIMAAIPSDQHVTNDAEFTRVVERAFRAAEAHDAIITIGVVPQRPEVGYGYLRLGRELDDELREVVAFVEKPDQETAESYVRSGDYLWNGGMFFMRAKRLIDEIQRHMPETAAGLAAIAAALHESPARGRQVTEERYGTLPAISIDYGVMERTAPVFTVPGDFGWNDVGSWSALADYRKADASGNITSGRAVLLDAKNNIVVTDEGTVVAMAGVSDLIVVRSGDALLILPRNRAQDVRDIVAALKDQQLDRFL